MLYILKVLCARPRLQDLLHVETQGRVTKPDDNGFIQFGNCRPVKTPGNATEISQVPWIRYLLKLEIYGSNTGQSIYLFQDHLINLRRYGV